MFSVHSHSHSSSNRGGFSPDDDTKKRIYEHLYVDDYLDSFDSEESAIQEVTKVKETLVKGDFHLRSWKSNSSRVNKVFGGSSEGSCDLLEEETSKRVLGLTWFPKTDILTFNVKEPQLTKLTRRIVVMTIKT